MGLVKIQTPIKRVNKAQIADYTVLKQEIERSVDEKRSMQVFLQLFVQIKKKTFWDITTGQEINSEQK